MNRLAILAPTLFLLGPLPVFAQGSVRLATFDVDATPPLGSRMAYDPVRRIDELTLRCRGLVIVGAEQPIVLCAVDWLAIGNAGHDAFCSALAEAAGTVPGRVAVHTLHQHDAPWCDFTAEELIRELGVPGHSPFEGTFHRQVIELAAEAIRAALPAAQPITHYGYGEAIVKNVASQRRIKGADGRIRETRWSTTKDSAVRAEPEGVIDPVVSLLSFWNDDKPVALVSTYACHPQSYYRLGVPSPDFPGIARFIRGQDLNLPLHVHFNGAGGNVTAGKYNDGAQANRMLLATRLADGMRRAYEQTIKAPLKPDAIGWSSVSVSLPPASHLSESDLIAKIKATAAEGAIVHAEQLAWLRRNLAGHQIDVTCLRVGENRMLHLPGEPFVEYQLAAKAMRPDLHVMMAGYGNYGPGYIGTEAAYAEGGYETEPRVSGVAPQVEQVLMSAIKQLLQVN